MVAMHKRYGQREVDLHAASQATEAKLKKKAKVEQELQNAITALKKPNPRIAVKELVEDAERRVAASRSRSMTIFHLHDRLLMASRIEAPNTESVR